MIAAQDEEEELRRWLESESGGATDLSYRPDPETQLQLAAGDDLEPLAGLAALQQAPAAPAEERIRLPDPPMRQKPNAGMHFLAAFADLVLNDGRGGAQILQPLIDDQSREYENYQRKVQHAQAEEALNRPRAGSAALDPQGRQLELARYNLSLRRLQNEEAATRAHEAQEAELGKLDSDATEQVRAGAIAAGFDPAEMNKLSGAQILKYRAQLGQEASQQRAFTQQRGTMDYAQQQRLAFLEAQEQKRLAGEEREAGREEASRGILGYHRSPDAPPISAGEATKLREVAAATATLDATLDRLASLDESISPRERALGLVGVRGELLSEANQLQQEAAAALRVIGNFGTPQGAELALINARAPEFVSADGFINGARSYRALKAAMRLRTNAQLGGYGYLPGNAPRAPRPRAAPPRSGGNPAPAPEHDETDPLSGL